MVKIPVEIDPRVAKQDAKNAVRNPIDALIELISNSMDSYNRIKGRGENVPTDGKVEVYIRGKKKDESIIAVKDWAEGIGPEDMEKYIKGYGTRTSGKDKFKSIRGYFGRGLKDAAGGLDGEGTIYSVKNDKISVGKIDGKDKNKITYEPVKTVDVTPEKLEGYYLDDGAKTIASVTFPTTEIRVPQFETIAEKLLLCVELRPLMEKSNVELFKMEKGIIKNRQTLKYNSPKGTRVHFTSNILVPGTSATYDIEIYKAEEELTQREERKFREGGLLIMSGGTVHEATLLAFEGDPNAVKFFGRVCCDHIDDLMRSDELIVTPDRQGLNWNHSFMEKLKKEIEDKLRPFVESERKERDRNKKGVSEETLKRNEKLGKKLGKLYEEIIKEEAGGSLPGTGTSDRDSMFKPPTGFGFVPSYYVVECGKKQKIRLLVDCPKIIPSYEKIKLESSSPEIVMEESEYLVGGGERVDELDMFKLMITIEGKQIDVLGEITATTKDKTGAERTAKALVKVKPLEGYPPNGFAFVPSSYRVKVGKSEDLILKIDGNLITNNEMKIKVESDNQYILVEENELSVVKEDGIIERRIRVRGEKTGEKGTIVAYEINNNSIRCTAEVKIISGEKTSPPSGFDIVHDSETQYPIQRSVCKENKIYIFINEPTVKMYYGNNGEYVETLSCRVLFADLILDAFCTKVVDDLKKTDAGSYMKGDEVATRSKYNKLKMKYGPDIHDENKPLLDNEREKVGGT